MTLSSDFMADEKSALLFIVEGEKIHISWELNGEIIAFEHIPENYPSSTLIVWKDQEKYLEAVRNVNWICNENVVVKDVQFDFGNSLKIDEDDSEGTEEDEWDEFIEKYKPVKNHLNNNAPYNGYMYETYGDEYKYIEKISVNPNTSSKIWTICEEDGVTFIQAGWHFVNRLGYIITEKPFENKEDQFRIK